jgi:ATP-dependent helicase HrpB
MTEAEPFLPIAPYLPEIARSARDSGVLVLSAEPGAGKTSLAPIALAEELGGKVLVVEPRRIAAVAAASRIAELWVKKLGDDVGYRVKGESRCGAASRIEVVTPGILVRMIQDDPSMERASAVVLDEFHERSIQVDLALAFLLEARQLRSKLRLVAMSATLGSGLAERLEAASISVPGRSFPIDTRHSPIAPGPRFEESFASLALELALESEGDLLAFLPGAAEIARAIRAFDSISRGRAEALALHGSMSLEGQRRILSPAPDAQRRVVFATSVAETSLTVPRVRVVLDSGLARTNSFQLRTGLNRLVTERETQDRAEQRRGRAGRLGPGLCVRAWSASETLPQKSVPEIFRSELSELVLEAAIWGARKRTDLPWLDPPPEGAWEAGTELLGELGALSPGGAPTDRGRRIARLGTEPRLAALVLRGTDSGLGWTACLTAALLSTKDSSGEGDLARRLEAFGERNGSGGDRAQSPNGDRAQSAPILAEARRLAQAADIREESAVFPAALGELAAGAFPDRIGKRREYRGANASFQTANGRLLRASGELARSEWLVALEADAGSVEGKIFSGCALSEEIALASLEPQTKDEIAVEWKGLSYKAYRERKAGGIALGRLALGALSREEIERRLAERIATDGLGFLPWEGEAGALLARLRWHAAKHSGGSGRDRAQAKNGSGGDRAQQPFDLDDAALAKTAEIWLCPHVSCDPACVLDGKTLRRALEGLLSRGDRAALDREAPECLALPSGSTRPIDYSSPGGPSVEAKVQEFFGLADQPHIGGGQPLILKLLDPGGKPLQVTSDLGGFWKGSWQEARKALKGRYPKHEWPEDPANASPSRSGIKKKQNPTRS